MRESQTFKKIHHLLELRTSNKGIKEMLFLLFLNFFKLFLACFVRNPEAAIRGVLLKKMFLNIFSYSLEDTCIGVSF